MKKNSNLEHLFIVKLPRYSMMIFILCIGVAMNVYPGGIYHMVGETGERMCPGVSCVDPGHHTIGYSFFKNFLSDLGRTTSHSEENNFHSSLLFNMVLTFAGVTYILFYLNIRKVFNNNFLASLGSFFGICGAVCFIGVAFTPADLLLKPHIAFNHWIFRFFLASILCYSWIMYKSHDIDNKYIIGNLVFIFSLVTYIFILIYGPTPRDPGGLEFQAISQKFIMFNFFGSIIIQTIGFSKVVK